MVVLQSQLLILVGQLLHGPDIEGETKGIKTNAPGLDDPPGQRRPGLSKTTAHTHPHPFQAPDQAAAVCCVSSPEHLSVPESNRGGLGTGQPTHLDLLEYLSWSSSLLCARSLACCRS